MTDEKDPKKDEAAESKKEEEKQEEPKASKDAPRDPRPGEEEAKPVKKKKVKDPADAYRLAANHPVANAWKTFAGMGLVGIVGAGVGYSQDHSRFAYAWLFGFVCALTLAIGAMMFVMMHHLTNGNWGVVVRRVAEVIGASTGVLLILIIPIIAMRGTLFGEWLKGESHVGKAGASLEVQQDSRDLQLAANEGLAEREDWQPGGGRNPHGPGGGPGGPGGFRMPGRGGPGGGPGGPGMPPGMGPGRTPAPGAPIHVQVGKSAEDRAEHAEHEEVMKSKAWYLSPGFFFLRIAGYFIVWIAIGWMLFKWSTQQDKTKDLALTVKMNRFSAPGIALLVLTMTFAAFDWVMSLDPTWYSTIFGVTFFAGSMVCIFATLILTFLGFRQAGVLVKEVTVEHYHDLGKLLFGFMCFWAYVCFSQFMLIWYASIPEELTFYHHRWDVGVWKNVSLALVALHFIIPFVFIMSRNIKRNLGMLRIGAWLLLTMHVIDIYWLILPNAPHQSNFAPSWIDVFGFMGPVGVFLAVAFYLLNRNPIIPVGDPRLERSIHFINA